MKISVAMCTYNGEKYIKEQLDSILKQTVLPDEIIIQDDNSTDNTIKIIKKIIKTSPVPIKLFVNIPGLGVMKNFITAFDKCNGDIVISCDQDDIWFNNKVEVFKSIFINREEINMIATDAILIDESGNELSETLREIIGFNVTDNHEQLIDELLRQPCITGATMAIRKKFITDNIYESEFWLHDAILAINAALNNSLLFLNECLTKYRIHPNQVCGVSKFSILKNTEVALTKPFYSEDLSDYRYKKYKEIKDHLKGKKNNINNIKKLDKCIDFWDERRNLRNQKFREFIKKTGLRKKEGQYKAYTPNKYGCILDRYTWIIYKLIPRKKK